MSNTKIKKILIIILVIFFIALILFLANIIRKYVIMKDILQKVEKYNVYSSGHFKTTSSYLDNSDLTRTSEIYIKDKKYVMISEFDDASGHNKTSLFINGDKWEVFRETPNGKTLQMMESKENLERKNNFSFEEFNGDSEIISKAITSKISKTKYNGKECYIIEDKQKEMYIDKDTGTVVKDIEGNHVQEYEYEFNIEISDNIFIKPNIEEYKVIE